MTDRANDAPARLREIDEEIERLLLRIAHEPQYLPHHRAIMELAGRRKVAGGRRGASRLWPRRYKNAVERLVAKERELIDNVLNLSAYVALIDAAERVAAEDATRDMSRVIEWLRSTARGMGEGGSRS